VDGRPWRIVPDDVVVRCRLSAGTSLERPLLRELRRELQRAEALALATRALAGRDLSRARLSERLRARGVLPGAGERAVTALEEVGLLDDERLARTRAAALAGRGWGDAAIEARLLEAKVAVNLAREAIAELRPETERAATLAAAVKGQRAAWNLLSRRGFALETVETVVGALDEQP
jgi:SOS response regulatory protein OraA/RecX